jgi:hypothetical protein
MAERIRAAAVELIRALAELTEKAEDMQPQTIVMTGTHHPGYYEWLMETEARR